MGAYHIARLRRVPPPASLSPRLTLGEASIKVHEGESPYVRGVLALA